MSHIKVKLHGRTASDVCATVRVLFATLSIQQIIVVCH
jgi:hypothetical protein